MRKILGSAAMPRDVVYMLIGAVLGGVTGVLTSSYYYQKALADAQADAAERSRELNLVMRGIEHVGAVKYHRDAAGKVKGVVVELEAHATTEASVSGTLK